jgi:hypothetical protein
MYTYVCNAKMIPVETVPELGDGRDEREQWEGGEFSYDLFDTL